VSTVNANRPISSGSQAPCSILVRFAVRNSKSTVSSAAPPPITAEWTTLGAEARHTFTHFHLLLEIRIATVSIGTEPEMGEFLDPATFRPSDLPTVMRTVFDLARPAFDTVM
jgi:A/G-specific adenine glycosylase